MSTPREIMKGSIALTAVLVLIMGFGSCSANRKTVLDPESDDFLSEVRYIITRKERKQFKTLPPAERANFIEEFWRVRDPDPDTLQNEYKDEYYTRIEKANHLFHEGSKGWLSDRGRIFILIGEPDRRDVYPTGYSLWSFPTEIWYYGFFTVVFQDEERIGTYRLSTGSAQKLNAINLAQMHLKHQGLGLDGKDLNFNLALSEKNGRTVLQAQIPHSNLALTENPNDKSYGTRFRYTLTISDKDNRKVSELKDSIAISISAEEFLKEKGFIVLNLPLNLAPGRYRADLYLENETDKKQKGQSLTVKIK